MHRKLTLNPRLRFIEEPDADENGGGAGSAGTDDQASQEGAESDADDTGEDDDLDESSFDANRALAKIKKLNSEARNLREAKKAAEAKAAGSDEKDTRIKALEAENLRIRIGTRNGLPDELIDRLKGDTEEEILADAEKLLGIVASKTPPPTNRPKERPGPGASTQDAVEETDVRKLGARMFQR